MAVDDVVGVAIAICFCVQFVWMIAVWVRGMLDLGLLNDALRKHRNDVWKSTFGDLTWRTFKLRDGKSLKKLIGEMELEAEPLSMLAKQCRTTSNGFSRFVWIMPLSFLGVFVLVMRLSFLLSK